MERQEVHLRRLSERLTGGYGALAAGQQEAFEQLSRQRDGAVEKLATRQREDHRNLSEQAARNGELLATLTGGLMQIEPIQRRQAEHEWKLRRLQSAVLHIEARPASSGPVREFDADPPQWMAAQLLPLEDADD